MKQISPPRMAENQETEKDAGLQEVIKVITSPEGWPEEKFRLDPRVRPYFDFREELNIVDGIVYKGQRIVVPDSMRSEALKILHAAHQGIVKSKQLARDLMYWPGINSQIEDIVSKCDACQERRNQQPKEPLLPTPVPEGPWEHVAMDLFDCLGSKWLICVDYYSEFFEIERLDHGTHGSAVIRQAKKWFCTHGIPQILTSDNGPPFNGDEWKCFAATYNFIHNTVSPLHPQGNGMVEKAVSIAKNLLLKCDKTGSDPYLALMNIRNTPRDDVTGSPAQRLFARRTRTVLPTATKKLKPKLLEPHRVMKNLQRDRHQRAKPYLDRNARSLKPLEQGNIVRVRVGTSSIATSM